MVLRLLLLPVTGPAMGLSWIGEKILEQANTEIDEKENLQKKLLSIQLAFDMGEISEEDFVAQEEEILLAIEEAEELEQEDSEV